MDFCIELIYNRQYDIKKDKYMIEWIVLGVVMVFVLWPGAHTMDLLR